MVVCESVCSVVVSLQVCCWWLVFVPVVIMGLCVLPVLVVKFGSSFPPAHCVIGWT